MDEQQVGYFTPLVADGLEQVVDSVAETRDWLRSVEMSWQWLLPWTSDRLNDLFSRVLVGLWNNGQTGSATNA
jgi:hypothetical protein